MMTGATRRWLVAGLAGAALLCAGFLALTVWERPPAPRPSFVTPRTQLFEELQPVALANCEPQRFGEAHDGGYLLCANLLTRVESGYSYGIAGYDGWGCDISRRLGVVVHQYDCFDVTAPACPGGRTVFHAECIASGSTTAEGRIFRTLAEHVAANGDTGRSLVVKMDVEGAEWESWLLAPDALLARIDQIAIEFHDVDDPLFVATVRRLKEQFHVAHLHFNNYSCDPSLAPFPASAYEVLLVNRTIGQIDPGGAVTRPHPLDAPNNPQMPDCQGAPPPVRRR